MKKILVLSCLLAFAIALSSVPAMANATLLFTSAGSNNYYGVPSYPYNLSVNGGPSQWMMCTGYNEHISGGETWMATAASVGSLNPVTNLLDYQAAFLFEKALASGGANGDINAAVWYLFEGVPTLDAGAQALVTLAQSQTYTAGEFPGVILYTAIPGSESGGLGTAQNFLGTPEPGTLFMFGTGLLGVAGVIRRRITS